MKILVKWLSVEISQNIFFRNFIRSFYGFCMMIGGNGGGIKLVWFFFTGKFLFLIYPMVFLIIAFYISLNIL